MERKKKRARKKQGRGEAILAQTRQKGTLGKEGTQTQFFKTKGCFVRATGNSNHHQHHQQQKLLGLPLPRQLLLPAPSPLLSQHSVTQPAPPLPPAPPTLPMLASIHPSITISIYTAITIVNQIYFPAAFSQSTNTSQHKLLHTTTVKMQDQKICALCIYLKQSNMLTIHIFISSNTQTHGINLNCLLRNICCLP